MKSTFKILFLLRKTRVDSEGKAPVCCRLTINGSQVEFNVQVLALAALWNGKMGKMIGRTEHAVEVNKCIDLIKNKLYNLYHEIQPKEKVITAKRLRDYYLGKAYDDYKISELFDKKIEQKKNLVPNTVCQETVDKYICTKQKVMDFILDHYDKEDIYITEVDYDFIMNYENYLLSSKGKCGHNTMVRHMRYLKQITTNALKCKYILEDPFYEVSYTTEKGNIKYLTIEELKKVMNYNLSTPELQKVRDVFVFSCFTGLAFSDIRSLKKTDVIQGDGVERFILKDRIKTGNESIIPLHDIAYNILVKYENNKNSYGGLFPVEDCQKMNIYIKEIAAICGIKNLSTHCGRHPNSSFHLKTSELHRRFSQQVTI